VIDIVEAETALVAYYTPLITAALAVAPVLDPITEYQRLPIVQQDEKIFSLLSAGTEKVTTDEDLIFAVNVQLPGVIDVNAYFARIWPILSETSTEVLDNTSLESGGTPWFPDDIGDGSYAFLRFGLKFSFELDDCEG